MSFTFGALQTFQSLSSNLFGSNPRIGGADPCCPSASQIYQWSQTPQGPKAWPVNNTRNGSGAFPEALTTRGGLMESPSPSGTGRIKDDVCDCIPFRWNGKYWRAGDVDAAGNFVPPKSMPEDGRWARWLEVSAEGIPVRSPSDPVTVPPRTGDVSEDAPVALDLAGAVPTASSKILGLRVPNVALYGALAAGAILVYKSVT